MALLIRALLTARLSGGMLCTTFQTGLNFVRTKVCNLLPNPSLDVSRCPDDMISFSQTLQLVMCGYYETVGSTTAKRRYLKIFYKGDAGCRQSSKKQSTGYNRPDGQLMVRVGRRDAGKVTCPRTAPDHTWTENPLGSNQLPQRRLRRILRIRYHAQ